GLEVLGKILSGIL
uniref:Temporin-AVa n=2 Tax=Rana arvalis TaxID=156871 RepID=TPAVA_RANAR|nr:RecName: Full=Temporin-AVa [Rana arvalis]